MSMIMTIGTISIPLGKNRQNYIAKFEYLLGVGDSQPLLDCKGDIYRTENGSYRRDENHKNYGWEKTAITIYNPDEKIGYLLDPIEQYFGQFLTQKFL